MMYSVVILAAGEGSRMEDMSANKVLLNLNHKSILERAMEWFKEDGLCEEIILVVAAADMEYMRDHFKANAYVEGGKTRRESVYAGLKHVSSPYVFIHDGARPFIGKEVIKTLLGALGDTGAATPALIVDETLKRVKDDIVTEHMDREGIHRIQTPQAFETDLIRKAHDEAEKKGLEATCDVTILEETLGVKARVVKGHPFNIKLTRAEDVPLLEMIADAEDWTK